MHTVFIQIAIVLTVSILNIDAIIRQEPLKENEWNKAQIMMKGYAVNAYFNANKWKQVDRNWKRGTYYTGLMAFFRASGDSTLLKQAISWSARHGWRTGTEWIYPANRMTCVQTYLEIYSIYPEEEKIRRAREVMDSRITNTDRAADQGWDYVDALYVGTPAYVMMSEATGDTAYAAYGIRMFRDVYNDLYDREAHLFYRDSRAKEKSRDGNNIFWSRGNGWAFASIPRILDHLPEYDPNYSWYLDLFQQMAISLMNCQGEDGFWRTNLAEGKEFPNPESSGTAFFVYGLAWGVNNGYLIPETFDPVIRKGWKALSSSVADDGKVMWGQKEARKPEVVDPDDWDEYVSGAFLLAASEMLGYSMGKTK